MSLDEGAAAAAFFVTNHQPIEGTMKTKANVKAGLITDRETG